MVTVAAAVAAEIGVPSSPDDDTGGRRPSLSAELGLLVLDTRASPLSGAPRSRSGSFGVPGDTIP
jgi:hypothetical protein